MLRLLAIVCLSGCGAVGLIAQNNQNLLKPYSGPSVAGVDVSTLDNKVMAGYQGWFNTPDDGADLGWTHWSRSKDKLFGPGNVTVDLWPDVSEYDEDELFETGFHFDDGSAAKVFSSHNRKTVLRHFQWMKDYGIDGVFVQRFANGLRSESMKYHKDVVLSHAREGANRNGRTYAVMYDLSGLPKGGTRSVRDDWKLLRSKRKITEDPAYLHHEGNPVVTVWGVGFNDQSKPREYTIAECRDLVEFLKQDGCTVMLGVPTGWRTLDRDALPDPELHEVVEMADIISPWTPGRYRDLNGITKHADAYWVPDNEWCHEKELDYLPVVFPGFSWHNLKGAELGAIPRLKGQFFWSQIAAAKRGGSNMIYVAMFDEVGEGTAIFKCTNNPPRADGTPFLDYEGLPSDFYLQLAGHAGKLLRGEIPLSEIIPESVTKN
ncbi:MAG: glycoside hydrolase family 71/99-like protein [Verrucomicrobia bacterium]|nr:glycoside hydrolase family 71/99-like protein [Verrucomicrobiota bacterium]